MFEEIPKPKGSGKVVGFKAVGKLTDEDYKFLIPKLEKVIA